jgi:hypothetical protein
MTLKPLSLTVKRLRPAFAGMASRRQVSSFLTGLPALFF